jgi:hypothetical protein
MEDPMLDGTEPLLCLDVEQGLYMTIDSSRQRFDEMSFVTSPV